jgi:hypothetical protein
MVMGPIGGRHDGHTKGENLNNTWGQFVLFEMRSPKLEVIMRRLTRPQGDMAFEGENIENLYCHDETITLGRALVRETVRPTVMNVVARCYVTMGVIARSALIRVIRDGIRIYPPPGQTVALDFLKNAASGLDVDEVGEGFECSMIISGFTRLCAGDVVDAYRVE